MSKRSHAQAFPEDDMLFITLSNATAQQIQADRAVIKLYSSIVRGLPADAESWNVSHILIDAQPVTRPVVAAWLNRCYRHAFEEPFEEQQDDPAVSMDGLYQLLAFADAVGSTKPVLKACVSQLEQLKLHVQLGEQQLELPTDGRYYYFPSKTPMRLAQATPSPGRATWLGEPAGSEDEKQALLKQVWQQTEQLLFLAYKLQLAPLADRLHAFLRSQVHMSCSIMPYAHISEVFSSRVLDAALGPNQLGKEAWLRSVLSEPCRLTTVNGKQQLFEPIGLTEEQKQPIEFEAKLVRDFMGMAKGSIVHVKVKLFEDDMDIGNATGVPASLNIHGPF